MAIVLHRIDVDRDAKQLTLHIQFSAASPIEARRAGYEWEGKKFRLSPEDDLLERSKSLATQDGLRTNAYHNELLVHAMEAVKADYPPVYPLAITGTLLEPSKPTLRERFKDSFPFLFPANPKL